jgi:anthranilate phosphoribosyltransferase
MADGVALAAETVASGKALAKMQQFVARAKALSAA